MARYTSTIQDILMMYCLHNHHVEPATTKEIIATAQKDLFNFEYDFYDPLLKDEFEKQFIRHFYMREIAYESIALFKLKLQDYLELNMDKWAIIYQKFNGLDPFINYDVQTDRKTDEDETKNQELNRENTLQNNREENQTNVLDTTGNTKEQNTTHATTNETATGETTDFTRQLDETTPDDRLNITANDGTGLIQYADSINETKGTTNDTKTTNTTNDMDESKQRNDTKNQVEDRHLSNKINQEQKENETKGNTRAFLQELAERKHGKIGNATYMSMYSEFIKNFDTINKQMFKEINKKCFLGLLN